MATAGEVQLREDTNITELQTRLGRNSEMAPHEQQFLYALVQHFKPQKAVEIGVSKGGSSAIILSALQNCKHSRLYSIDRSIHVYSRPDKLVGFLINETFPELLPHWSLFTGVITAEVIRSIGPGIDFVLLDTVHVTPGEMLDFLQVLPFLAEKAVIVFHDISLQFEKWGWTLETGQRRQRLFFSNNLLYYYLRGKKVLPQTKVFPNIGAVVLDPKQRRYYLDYFFPLGIQWEYIPPDDDIGNFRTFVNTYYGSTYLRIFDEALKENRLFVALNANNSKIKDLNRRYLE